MLCLWVIKLHYTCIHVRCTLETNVRHLYWPEKDRPSQIKNRRIGVVSHIATEGRTEILFGVCELNGTPSIIYQTGPRYHTITMDWTYFNWILMGLRRTAIRPVWAVVQSTQTAHMFTPQQWRRFMAFEIQKLQDRNASHTWKWRNWIV